MTIIPFAKTFFLYRNVMVIIPKPFETIQDIFLCEHDNHCCYLCSLFNSLRICLSLLMLCLFDIVSLVILILVILGEDLFKFVIAAYLILLIALLIIHALSGICILASSICICFRQAFCGLFCNQPSTFEDFKDVIKGYELKNTLLILMGTASVWDIAIIVIFWNQEDYFVLTRVLLFGSIVWPVANCAIISMTLCLLDCSISDTTDEQDNGIGVIEMLSQKPTDYVEKGYSTVEKGYSTVEEVREIVGV